MFDLEERGKRLVKYGFIKDSARHKYEWDEEKKYYVPKEGDYNAKDADQEYHEQAMVMPAFQGHEAAYVPSGYPDTVKKYRLTFQGSSVSLEETYYWIMDYMKREVGFPHFKKIVDVFSASEQSAFWGQAQQRIGLQQDRATNYMATIGKMVKDLFQLVRELRIIEERLEIYKKAPHSKSADVTLKGLFIDMVEGGSKNPSSVYGIAQQVGFTTLPDLFFNTHIYDINKVDEKIDAMDFNKQVKNVLRRKLFSLLNWKQRTEQELKSRFEFTLKYLRQHWTTIQMYMNWVKPYLRNVQRLRMKEEHMDSEELITAFETSMTEIEVLAMKPLTKGLYSCVLFSVTYTTQPEMSYHQEGYQHRGPLHVGKVQFHLRAYGWTPQEVENFYRLKQEEDMELIKMVDESVSAAMDALGDELRDYLDRAGEKLAYFGIKKSGEDEDGKKKTSLGEAFSPFTSVFGGIGELFGSLFKWKKQDSKKPEVVTRKQREKAAKAILNNMYLTYKNYKKGHGMIHW